MENGENGNGGGDFGGVRERWWCQFGADLRSIEPRCNREVEPGPDPRSWFCYAHQDEAEEDARMRRASRRRVLRKVGLLT